MSQIAGRTKRRSWRRKTYVWMFNGVVGVSALIYWEQTALLFVISTLALCILLSLVAFADLEGRDRESNKEAESDHTAETESASSLSPVLTNRQSIKKNKGVA